MLKKITKRVLKIILWFIGIIFALDLLMVTLLFVPPIQQFVLLKVSKLLTNITGGEITMDKIYLSPFLTLTAKNFAIQDHQHENMIFASTLQGRINFTKTNKGQVCLSFAQLEEGEVMLRKYAGEEKVNIALWAEGFKKKEKKDPKFKLLFENILLNDVRFVFINDDKRLYKDDNTIDYGFFELQHINLNVDNFLVFGPDISCKINSLTLSQYTGFEISGFTGNFRIFTQGLQLDDLHFTTPNSTFLGNFAFQYNDFPDYSDFVNLIYFDTEVKSASVAMRDIIYFAPKLNGMDDQIVFSGHVSGPVNHLKTENVFLKYKLLTRIAGNFAIENVLDFKNSMVDLDVSDAYIAFSELTQLKLPQGKTIKLPEIAKKLTYSTISGHYAGSFTQFNTNLVVNTNLGTAHAIIKTIPKGYKLNYLGNLACQNLNIAKLFNQPNYLNKVTFSSAWDCEAENTGKMDELLASLSLSMNGKIEEIGLCGYPLKNISIKGNYSQKNVSLSLNSTDSIALFNVKGNLNFAKETPSISASLVNMDMKVYDFFSHYVPKLDSNAVGFEKFIYKVQQVPNLVFTMDSISMTMNGNKFENLNGFVGIDYAKLTNGEQTSRIDWLRFTAINIPNLPHQYQMHTNAFSASLKTNYNLQDFVAALENSVHFYLPKMFDNHDDFPAEKEILSTESKPFIDFDLKLFYTRNIFNLLLPQLDIVRDAFVSVHIGKTRKEDYFNFSFPRITYTDMGSLNNLNANGILNEQNILDIQLHCDSLTLYQKNGNLTFSNIGIHTESNKDEIQFKTFWRNPSKISLNEQNIFCGTLWKSESEDFSLTVTDSKLFLRKSLWQFSGSENSIHFGKNRFLFNHCILSSAVGEISIDGEISKELDKECTVLFDNFDISLINSFIAKSRMSFEGNMSLIAQIKPHTNNFNVEGKAYVKNFIFNEEPLGDLFLEAKFLRDDIPYFTGGILSKDNANIDLAKFTIDDYSSLPNRIIALDGKFFPTEKELRVHAAMDTLKIGFLSPFLSSFSDIISGEASGYLDFIVNPDSLYFDGKVRVKNAQMGITPLNTVYYINNQEILFNREGILFEKIQINDRFNNNATLSGYVHHKKFKDFKIDLNISTPRIMALNTPRKIDNPFFGDGFVSGDISIQGDTKLLNFTSQNIKTLPGSSITFPLNSATSVSSAKGIYFVQNKEIKGNTAEETNKTSTLMNFDFVFDINRDADVKLELDPIDGVLKCKTTGRLHLAYHTDSGNMDLDGILSIVSGSFYMSLRNFFPRNFSIVEGGTISFVGPLTSAQINVSALYQKASTLRSLSPELSKIGRTDVNAYLRLAGNLMNPKPTFDFSFPRLTNEEQFLVFAALDTANHQNGIRQFFSFVFLNTFFTSETKTNAQQQSFDTGIDMVSGILSSFISNQFDNFNFGVNYINDQENYTEYSVNTEMNFYNGRIKLKTNLGYGDDKSIESKNKFVGDAHFEIGLNEEQNWKLNIFWFNDVNKDDVRPQQGGGIGISYKHDFNNRKDFIKSWTPKKKDKKKKKNSSLTSIDNE